LVTLYAIENQKIGAIIPTFIEEIFEKVCKGTTFSLVREESEGGIPCPGTFSGPVFNVHDSYTERIVASFSNQMNSYCNHSVFQDHYDKIGLELKKAINQRRKEQGLEILDEI
jgi:hypothetical protein